MSQVLVDSSVLLDVVTDDPVWLDWSARQLWQHKQESELVINALIYAEVSAAFDSIEGADRFFADVNVRREDVPWAAAFAAGQLFKASRKRQAKAPVHMPLPDYFIASHAMVCGYRLLSRDRGYAQSSFSALNLIAPDTHP
jgi:predicted nucleic acid-binding protein